MKQMNMNELEDLVPDILFKLPVKSLVRFKNVHKSWQNIMKNPRFISRHMKCYNAVKDSISPTFLVTRSRPLTFDPEYLSRKAFVSLLTFDQRGDGANGIHLSLLDLPYNQNEIDKVFGMGPCNGLYCLYSNPTCLINPSLRQVKVVTESDVSAPPERYTMQKVPGFGYDPQTDDYKFILVKDSWRGDYYKGDLEKFSWRCLIYSLNTNSWREVKSPVLESISIWEFSYIDSFCNGACHWYGYDDVGDFVLAFDIVTEIFRKIRLSPIRSSLLEEMSCIKGITGTVAAFKKSLTMISYPYKGREKWFDIWVMEDYKNDNSWKKKLRIGPLAEINIPLGFFGDQFIFENSNGQMVIYDHNTRKIKNLGFQGEQDSLEAMEYMESLVSLKRGDQLNEIETSFLNLVPDPLII